jgi:crotonobetainyl-CoA:carnitine CoA-transferase CaiB-like acyl-CoA transferase
MMLTGDPGAPPTKAGYSAVDNSAGIMAAVGLLAKIVEGKGGQVDVSMFDAMLSQLNYLAGAYLNAGEKPARQKSGSHPYVVPAQTFQTRDGYLTLFVSHDGFWRLFANEVGRPEWVEDPRFATMKARAANRDLVIEAVQTLLLQRDTAHWVERFSRHGLVVAGVETLDQALEGELARSRDMVAAIPTPDGVIRVVGNPIKITGHETRYGRPPLLGEHTEELLPTP